MLALVVRIVWVLPFHTEPSTGVTDRSGQIRAIFQELYRCCVFVIVGSARSTRKWQTK
jgi:hypothetical protein